MQIKVKANANAYRRLSRVTEWVREREKKFTKQKPSQYGKKFMKLIFGNDKRMEYREWKQEVTS